MKNLALLVVAVSAVAWGQGKPVSARGAFAVIARHEKALSKLVKTVTPVQSKSDAGNLSRSAFILEMERVFDQAKPEFRWTPTYYRQVESSVVQHNTDPKVQAAIRKLTRYGCIGPVSPVVVGPGDTLTAQQFGDTLSMFTLRIAHLTHQPDPKWTPTLTFDTGS
jgi:hypothetical protein